MSLRVNAIVGFITSNDLFDLDVMDLDEMNGFDVLDRYGLYEILDESEEALLMDEMYRLAGRVQTAEIARNTPTELLQS